jgi:2-polyprenyl-3-methyl-5-hydroxy-6-metoxy-1,4-benzoquinol methylase
MTVKPVATVEMSRDHRERVYSNDGNAPLIDLLDKKCSRLLDIGCGAGGNAALVRAKFPDCDVFGITYSAPEASLAQAHMVKCWVADIEAQLPSDLENQSFDALILSHVLEHLRDPPTAVAHFSRLLRTGGQVLIAVPNILYWAMRLQFLRGDFEYQPSGMLDDTHLHFFTYLTASRYLLSQSPNLELTHTLTTGSVPLWWLRRYILPVTWSRAIDAWGCRHWPNLFGYQVLLRAVKH